MEERERLRKDVESSIRNVPDFPKPGILFRDITPVLRDGALFRRICDHFSSLVMQASCGVVAGIESRGFIFAAPVACLLGLPLAVIRKPKKLPWRVVQETYSLEYGTDTIEMHEDAIRPGEKVALIDDLLATGGTALAATRLIRKLGGEVGLVAFLIELVDLNGRKQLEGLRVDALVPLGGPCAGQKARRNAGG